VEGSEEKRVETFTKDTFEFREAKILGGDERAGLGVMCGLRGLDSMRKEGTLADCKSSNLVYQLQCKKCNAFYIGETGQILSKCVNVHHSTCTVINSDLLVPIQT